MASQLARFAEVSALAGDPARAVMLHALMDGRALTATELSRAAGIAAPTASGHLTRLVQAGLLAVEKQGRHRYHRLASAAVARMLESIMQVANDGAPAPRPVRVGPRDAALREARTCYDHLAGRLGVAIADGLAASGRIDLDADAVMITPAGTDMLQTLGVELRATRSRRLLCRPCLDWSERRPHLAGRLGAALCELSLARGWVRRQAGTRALLITPEGKRIYRNAFGVVFDQLG